MGWKPGGRGSDYVALGSRWLRRRVVRFHRTSCPFFQARAPWRLAPCLCDSRCVKSLLAVLRVGVSDVLFISELTPMDPNVRLTKRDSPEVVDPRLHRRMRSIVGCLSYLVNMTRPDLAFTYSQLSKFVQSPGPVHLAAAERALAYLRGTYNEGITYCNPVEERRNKLTGWVDSDFAADPDTRKSMTGYLFSLNGGAVSWRSS